MSDHIPRTPRGLLARGAPTQSGPTAFHSVNSSASIGAVRPSDPGFNEPEYCSTRRYQQPGLVLPSDGRSPFQGGDDYTTDKAKSNFSSRIDSGIYSGELETSMQSMSISHPRSQPSAPTAHVQHHNKLRRPVLGQAKTTRIVEMSKNNISSTVQAPSHRSNSSSLTYSSTQPSYGQYPSNYSTPMHHYVTPNYPPQPQQQQQHFVDVRAMLQQNIHHFMQDREGDT